MSVQTDHPRSAPAEPLDEPIPASPSRLILQYASGAERAIHLPIGPCRIGMPRTAPFGCQERARTVFWFAAPRGLSSAIGAVRQ